MSLQRWLVAFALVIVCWTPLAPAAEPAVAESFDVVVVGGTPGGIMAAIGAARGGRTVVILDRTEHLGGLPANGLGATDIATRGVTGGLFLEFVGRVKKHYVDTYGPTSPQAKDASDGYHFEPSVAERIFLDMLDEHKDRITVRKRRQFDAEPANVVLTDSRLTGIVITNRETNQSERYDARVFIDATYEGDLAAAAGVPYRLGREGKDELNEPMAGRLYKPWRGEPAEGSTGMADNAVQAYNYRLCLTRNAEDRVPIAKPANYDREEFASLVGDIVEGHYAGKPGGEKSLDGIGRLVNMVVLPNGKTDANNQHLAFLSTDLPEENWPWPTSDWAWRDQFAERLRDYTLGLLWFAQNDEALPVEFRSRCLEWGLSKSEYQDNGHFPRQVYVREGRRMEGTHLFTAHDAISRRGSRQLASSVTASHYALDSHAVRKREPGRVHLDGFFSYPSRPYSVPYGVMLPKKVDGLLMPVAVSGTHIGFSTMRMEPCWMALGQAAGTAAALSIEADVPLRAVDVLELQRRLLGQGAVLIHFQDAKPGSPHYEALQFFALRGFLGTDQWQAKLAQPATEAMRDQWAEWAGVDPPALQVGKTTRGELLDALYASVRKLPAARVAALHAP
jgi:hypothetical protein